MSNWRGFHPAGVVGLLHAAGFDEVRVLWPASCARRLGEWACNAANVVYGRLDRSRNSLALSHLPTGRLVVHAFKSTPG